MLRTAIITLSLALASPLSAQAQALDIRADVFPTHGLPGVMPVVKAVVSNTGSARVQVPGTEFCIEGVKEAVKVFGCRKKNVAMATEDGDVQTGTADADLYDFANVWWDAKLPRGPYELGPHEQRSFVQHLQSPCAVPELLQPGRYELRLVLPRGGTSNTFTYTVDEPGGNDAVVWKQLVALMNPSVQCDAVPAWELDAATQQLLAQYPDSVYAKISRPLRDAVVGASGSPLQKALAYVAAGVPEPYDSNFRVMLGAAYQQDAVQLAMKGALDQAVEEANTGKNILDLVAKGRNEYAAAAAAAALSTGPWTRDELRKDAGTITGTDHVALKPSLPQVDCVRINNDGTFTVWFGYSNPNPGTYLVPIGAKNHFEPAPENRGQPVNIEEGEQPRAFSVTVPVGDKIVWVLEGHRATATANEGTRECPSDPGHKP